MKIAIILGLFATAGAGVFFWYRSRKSTPAPPNLPAVNNATPHATINSNAPISVDLPPPSPTPISADSPAIAQALKNEAYKIATNSTIIAMRRQANAPASAFFSVANADDRQKILAAFSPVGNGLDSANYPFTSVYTEQATDEDTARILAILAEVKRLEPQAFAAAGYIENNGAALTLRAANLNIKPLVKTFATARKTAVLIQFFTQYQHAREMLNAAIMQQAKANLRAAGYNII